MTIEDIVHRAETLSIRIEAKLAGRKPWSWASLPGLRGRPLSTRFSIGDWLEEFSLHDALDGSIVVREWCRTSRLTAGLCREPGLAERFRARIIREQREETR